MASETIKHLNESVLVVGRNRESLAARVLNTPLRASTNISIGIGVSVCFGSERENCLTWIKFTKLVELLFTVYALTLSRLELKL